MDIKKAIKRCMPDKMYLKWLFPKMVGYKLNIDNPKTFNEKLQWLKINDRNPLYTSMVDKYEAKKVVAEIIGEQYVIPTLGVWDKASDIDFDTLPDCFVLKATHDSGSVFICKNKKEFDCNTAKEKLDLSLKRNFYWDGREWPYKNVRPRIIAEKYMEDNIAGQLMDYKIHVFNGKAQLIEVDFDRFSNHKRNIYDRQWKYLPLKIQYPTYPEIILNKPEKLKELLEIAEKLGRDIPYVRVDLYLINNLIYFGEYTFYHGGGMEKFEPLEWEYTMGKWIDTDNLK